MAEIKKDLLESFSESESESIGQTESLCQSPGLTRTLDPTNQSCSKGDNPCL